MKRITIYRPEEKSNKNCCYSVFIGDEMIAELSRGDSKTIEIPEKFLNDYLQVKIQWCGSKKVSINNINNDSKLMVLANTFLHKKLPIFTALFPLTGLLIFYNNDSLSKNIGIGILFFYIIGIISVLTFGKNQWLHLKAE